MQWQIARSKCPWYSTDWTQLSQFTEKRIWMISPEGTSGEFFLPIGVSVYSSPHQEKCHKVRCFSLNTSVGLQSPELERKMIFIDCAKSRVMCNTSHTLSHFSTENTNQTKQQTLGMRWSKEERKGSEQLGKLTKITQLIRGRSKISTQLSQPAKYFPWGHTRAAPQITPLSRHPKSHLGSSRNYTEPEQNRETKFILEPSLLLLGLPPPNTTEVSRKKLVMGNCGQEFLLFVRVPMSCETHGYIQKQAPIVEGEWRGGYC